jgi:hypothetical protein
MLRNVLFACWILSFISFIAYAVSLFATWYFWLRAGLNRNPGRSRRWYVRMNRSNAVYFSDELSPNRFSIQSKAFKSARLMLASILAFTVVWAIAFVMTTR